MKINYHFSLILYNWKDCGLKTKRIKKFIEEINIYKLNLEYLIMMFNCPLYKKYLKIWSKKINIIKKQCFLKGKIRVLISIPL